MGKNSYIKQVFGLLTARFPLGQGLGKPLEFRVTQDINTMQTFDMSLVFHAQPPNSWLSEKTESIPGDRSPCCAEAPHGSTGRSESRAHLRSTHCGCPPRGQRACLMEMLRPTPSHQSQSASGVSLPLGIAKPSLWTAGCVSSQRKLLSQMRSVPPTSAPLYSEPALLQGLASPHSTLYGAGP